MVSGLFGRSSCGTASEICHLWVPAAEVVVAAAGPGSTLTNNSLTDTRSSSSSLETMKGDRLIVVDRHEPTVCEQSRRQGGVPYSHGERVGK